MARANFYIRDYHGVPAYGNVLLRTWLVKGFYNLLIESTHAGWLVSQNPASHF